MLQQQHKMNVGQMQPKANSLLHATYMNCINCYKNIFSCMYGTEIDKKRIIKNVEKKKILKQLKI